MKVLGIETSCDETGAAVVDDDGRVLSDVVASQIDTHAQYGGVVPELASRAHLRNLVPVVERAVDEAGGLDAIDAIAVTQGPGLVGALLVGIQAAKALAWSRELPLVGVNHLDGHLLAPFLRRGAEEPPAPQGEYVALLASGGHTAVYRVQGKRDIALLGQTRDDAAGEAYDKVAKLLELGYPGGPIIDRLAPQGDPRAVSLPVPMRGHERLEFSFAGLKTAVAHRARDQHELDERAIADLCASFQHVAVEHLVEKGLAACRQEGVSSLVLTGGVAANRGLRARAAQACEQAGVELHVPPFASCTDNGAMIAYAGLVRLVAGERDELTLRAYSRDPERRRGVFRPDGSFVPRTA